MGSDTVWAFVLLQPGPEQIPGWELNLDAGIFKLHFSHMSRFPEYNHSTVFALIHGIAGFYIEAHIL